MFSHFEPALRTLDKMEEGLESEAFRDALLTLPVELWGHMLLSTNEMSRYPRLSKMFPKLPSLDIQARFVGGSGEALLPRNANFIRVFEAGVAGSLEKPLRNLRILDYGCGWGRLARYFLRYCAPGDLVAVDPQMEMVDLLRSADFPADVRHIPAIPDSETDIGSDFDVVNLYSIFTHLPDWLLSDIMSLLLGAVKPDGVVVFTIRSREFWPYYYGSTKDERFAGAANEHDKAGYVFVPHRGMEAQPKPTYGDAGYSMGP